ncbi:MAG: cyclic nucleotide-binding domain-containing protein [Hyphomicrobiales bacterium]|nr:MAG: cyclic nucleotide-binding domain-containing protein [Hyphomicrobiales bacterium]
MANLLTLTNAWATRSLEPGDRLIEAGESGGELFVLVSGRLAVNRDGIEIARISEPGALVGEMSVVLGVDHSATVTALTPVQVRMVEDGMRWLQATPLAALHVATLACERLDATSALLVELRKDAEGSKETGFLERLFGAVTGADVRS